MIAAGPGTAFALPAIVAARRPAVSPTAWIVHFAALAWGAGGRGVRPGRAMDA